MRPLAAWMLAAACGGNAPPPAPAAPEPAPAVEAPAEVAGPRQLCVARHAESHQNLGLSEDEVPRGKWDALTEAGEARARAMAAELPSPIGLALASPTGRTVHTAQLLGLPVATRPDFELLGLRGEVTWQGRVEAAAAGADLAPRGTESLADGAARAGRVVARLRERTPPGTHAVVVSHGDFAPLLLGEALGTPILERPAKHAFETGALRCVPLDPPTPAEPPAP